VPNRFLHRILPDQTISIKRVARGAHGERKTVFPRTTKPVAENVVPFKIRSRRSFRDVQVTVSAGAVQSLTGFMNFFTPATATRVDKTGPVLYIK
jgi:hypothetical protein